MARRVATAHRIKITLRGTKPPVWRRIVVPSDLPLPEVAAVLEAAMGWHGEHLHDFEVGNVRYLIPEEHGMSSAVSFDVDLGGPGIDLSLLGGRLALRTSVDERTVVLSDVIRAVGTTARWTYDFGDGWVHDLAVESIDLLDPAGTYPECIAGRRACPPEDSGGPVGYADLLRALADRDHPRHAAAVEWAPVGFDPAAFDPDTMTAAMRHPRAVDRLW